MFCKSPTVVAALVAGALSLAAPAGAQTTSMTVTEDFGGGGGSWEGGSEMIYRYGAQILNGEIVVCGAVAMRSANSHFTRLSRKVLQEARITLRGNTILRDMSFFNIVSSAMLANDLIGAEATCKSTGEQGTEADYPDLAFATRGGTYRVRK